MGNLADVTGIRVHVVTSSYLDGRKDDVSGSWDMKYLLNVFSIILNPISSISEIDHLFYKT
jgi:hypothetical protein